MDRQRHVRLFWYALVSFSLTMFGRYVLEFDYWQSIGYAVTAFVLLVALNRRAVLSKPPIVASHPRPTGGRGDGETG